MTNRRTARVQDQPAQKQPTDVAGNNTDESASEQPVKRQRRTFAACYRCHKSKIKCTGGQPCENCQSLVGGPECKYPDRDRKVQIQESQLKRLQRESQLWHQSLQKGSSAEASVRLATRHGQNQRRIPRKQFPNSYTLEAGGDESEDTDGRPTTNLPDADIRNPLIEDRAWFVTDHASTQPIYIGEAACTAFGTRLRQFLGGSEPVAPLPRSNYVKDKAFARMSPTEIELPTKTYAQLLIKVALRFLGNDYHLMLVKTTLSRLDGLYRGESFDDPVFLCKLFAIFAMGEMYSNQRAASTKDSTVIPGTKYFIQAITLFQDLHEEATVQYIETLLIMSLYSLALNRTNSAYTYSGIALRLCLTLGLHHNLPEGYPISAVEREHRIRVFWSIYITDRITSSKLGHPLSVRDSDIDVDIPTMAGLTAKEQAEFADPAHIVAHLKLARITGEIISDIYGRSSRQDQAFVYSVQKILRNLRSWAETLPENVRLNSASPYRYASRNVASLHLCFNQCVILTTRPVLFHVFKSYFQEQGTSRDLDEDSTMRTNGNLPTPTPSNSEMQARKSQSSMSPLTTTLADACIHAARDSNSLLTQLWVDSGMAVFGFFDAQYLFSSTIILMMSAVLNLRGYSRQRAGHPLPDENASSAAGERDRDAVNTASDIMESMVRDGNLPAAGFHQHFLEIKKSLGFDELSPEVYHSGKSPSITSGPSELSNHHHSQKHGLHPQLQTTLNPYHQSPSHFDANTATNLTTNFTSLSPHDPLAVQTALHDPGIQNFLAQHDISFGLVPGNVEMDLNFYPAGDNMVLFSAPSFFQ